MSTFPTTSASAFAARRSALAVRLAAGGHAAVLLAGQPAPRNYPANTFPFRASSHFLYLVGLAAPGSALVIDDGKSTLFLEPPSRDDALWHGPRPSLAQARESYGVDAVRPLGELGEATLALRGRLATLAPQDAASARELTALLGRDVVEGRSAELVNTRDVALAEAMIALRLAHDEAAVAQLAAAAAVSSRAHVAGMRATRRARTEAEVCAAIVNELRLADMGDAYGPIVTVHGEILHAHGHENALTPGDLLLCDVGGESPEGWASDITRTWPTSGTYSPTQRAIYDVVLAANERAIAKVRPGTSYRAVHEEAKRTLVVGLVELGILRGEVDGLLERGAANVFFPHGVGHLLGLDVHDMEDLGDRAGYAPGRVRSARFGDRYLRLDRDLAPGMAVTIEPGFYQVPGILEDEELLAPLGQDLRRDVLARFADVRGIRIEDDVLCTEGEPRVLTAGCPKAAAAIEDIMR